MDVQKYKQTRKISHLLLKKSLKEKLEVFKDSIWNLYTIKCYSIFEVGLTAR